MILKSAISADSLLAKDAFRASFHLHFLRNHGITNKISLVSYIVWQERYATDITDPQSGEFMTIKNKMLLGALLLVTSAAWAAPATAGSTNTSGISKYATPSSTGNP